MVADNPNLPIPKNPHKTLAMELPKEPPIGLLMSMALRLDHALGCPGYYDQEFLAMPGVSHARRVEVALADMRKVYEEVTGQGFYRPDIEENYAAMVPNVELRGAEPIGEASLSNEGFGVSADHE